MSVAVLQGSTLDLQWLRFVEDWFKPFKNNDFELQDGNYPEPKTLDVLAEQHFHS